MIIISLLALGGIVAAGRKINLKSAMILFAITGLFHGSAFGASIAGQENCSWKYSSNWISFRPWYNTII